jgi:hypothetical protein
VTAVRQNSVADGVDEARRPILLGAKEKDRMGTPATIAAGEAASPQTFEASDVRSWNLWREDSK